MRYVVALVLIIGGVFALLFTPDLYKLSDLNFGPCLAFACTAGATLVFESAES